MPTFPDLMSQSVDGMFAIDARHRVIFWNRAAESMTGIPVEHAMGRRCHEVLKGHDQMGRPLCKPGCPLSNLSAGGPSPAQLPMRITHANGQTMQFCVGTMLIPSAENGQWNVVHVMRRGRNSQAEDLFDCHPKHAGREVNSARADQTKSQHAASLLTGREIGRASCRERVCQYV